MNMWQTQIHSLMTPRPQPWLLERMDRRSNNPPTNNQQRATAAAAAKKRGLRRERELLVLNVIKALGRADRYDLVQHGAGTNAIYLASIASDLVDQGELTAVMIGRKMYWEVAKVGDGGTATEASWT